MKSKRVFINSVPILNSDKNILDVFSVSNKFFEDNPDFANRVEKCLEIWWSIFELVPQTVDKALSGHGFPAAEAQYEAGSSIELAKLGFYKHALMALRNALELSLLSVYWDIDGRSHILIQDWVRSKQDTPFKKTILVKINTHPNVIKLLEKYDIHSEVDRIYKELSNFSHTKGGRYSSSRLNASNVNTFRENSLVHCLNLMEQVTTIAAAYHLLLYPVGMQYTPVEEKFGLNGPMGGFLEPGQMEALKIFLGREPELLQALIEISDSDKQAVELAEWITAQPDVTSEEFDTQAREFDQLTIEVGGPNGFQHWLKNEKRMIRQLVKLGMPNDEQQKRKQYLLEMTNWARTKGLIK